MANSSEEERKHSRDRELGMHRDITRRDFLNGMAIAAGGAIGQHLAAGIAGCANIRRPRRTHLATIHQR